MTDRACNGEDRGQKLTVLFVSLSERLDPCLGGPQSVLELAEALRSRGIDVRYFSRGDVTPGAEFIEALFAFLRRTPEIEVVDVMDAVEIQEIPHDLRDRVWVARVTLLEFHFEEIRFSTRRPGWRGRILDHTVGPAIDRRRENAQRLRRQRLARFYRCADLIAVANLRDRDALLRRNFAPSKVVVQRYALSESRRNSLEQSALRFDEVPRISFLGTFDFRKGCWDLVALFQELSKDYPELELRLLGTRGMCPGEAEVRRFFPRALQSRLQVVPRFEPDRLPELLGGIRLGVFPSYVESFGLAIVEQMIAGLPVIAYDAPGPDGILPSEWLCPTGDTSCLESQIREMLALTSEKWNRLSKKARSMASPLSWAEPAETMEAAYRTALARKGLTGAKRR